MKHARARLPKAPTRLLLAATLPLLAANSGCFMFGGAKPVPPTVVINQPIVLSQPEVVEPVPPPPAIPATTVKTATPEKVTPPDHVIHPRRYDHTVRRHPETHPKTAANAPHPSTPGAPLPLLTPGLSPEQQNVYRNSTLHFLTDARNALNVLNSRNLTSDQVATRTQASEWVRQAQIALNQGDVVRAQNLARKASVLTHALIEQTQ